MFAFFERGTGLPSAVSAAFVLRERWRGPSGVCEMVRDDPGGGDPRPEPRRGLVEGVPLEAISLGPCVI